MFFIFPEDARWTPELSAVVFGVGIGGHEGVADRLREHGLEEAEGSISNKLSRGIFPASFFLAVMKAIGRETISLGDV